MVLFGTRSVKAVFCACVFLMHPRSYLSGDCNSRLQICPLDIFGNKAATDGTKLDLNIGETRVWRLDSGPNLQPCNRATKPIYKGIYKRDIACPGMIRISIGFIQNVVAF